MLFTWPADNTVHLHLRLVVMLGLLEPQTQEENWRRNRGGCFLSGAAGVLVGHPFDTVKVG